MISIEQNLINNFMRYVAVTSQSDASVDTIPSTKGQRELAMLLCQELNQLGITDTQLFDSSVAIVRIPGTQPNASAKNVLVNPNLIATDFINLIRDHGLPEQTDGREGYFWVTDLHGSQNTAKVSVAIRDFDQENYESRKAYLESVLILLNHKYPKAVIELTITDVYSNIAQAMGENTGALTRLYEALDKLNIPAKTIAMRGGTDGSALSIKGLFTPNFFTGAHNFHSQFEFLPITSFVDSYNVAKKLITMS